MNLSELKTKPISELLETAHEMGLDNVSRTRKQDVIFQMLKRHAKNGEISTAMVFLKFSRMVLAFSDQQILPTWPVQMIFMYLPAKSGALV